MLGGLISCFVFDFGFRRAHIGRIVVHLVVAVVVIVAVAVVAIAAVIAVVIIAEGGKAVGIRPGFCGATGASRALVKVLRASRLLESDLDSAVRLTPARFSASTGLGVWK